MPSVRCTNCNKPIGHLHELYEQLVEMGHDKEEVFKMLAVSNYCCTEKLSFAPRTNLVTCIEYKMKDLPSSEDIKNTYKEIIEVIEVNNEEDIKKDDEKYNKQDMSCIPLQLKTSNTVKVLNDALYINYIKECHYLAQ